MQIISNVMRLVPNLLVAHIAHRSCATANIKDNHITVLHRAANQPASAKILWRVIVKGADEMLWPESSEADINA